VPLPASLARLRDLATEVGARTPWAGQESNLVAVGGAGPDDLDLLRRHDVPPGVLDFVGQCEYVTLADVGNGYFIHDPKTLDRDLAHGAPRRIADPGWQVFPFGSDGVGGRFVLRLGGGGVYHLPEGAVEAGEYIVGHDPPIRVADDLHGFVAYLIEVVEQQLGRT